MAATGQMPWGVTEELLAQVVEEVSVMTAQRRRKDVRHVTRPYTPPPAAPDPRGPQGYQALLAAATAQGRVRTVPGG